MPVKPPGLEVAVYPVIAVPPFGAGAVKVTVACVFPRVAVPIVGAPGTMLGTTPLEALEAAPVPTAFVAWTVKVYAVPFVKPVTVNGLAPPVAVKPPGLDVTVYPVIGLPPSEAGAVKSTVACVFPAVAVPIVGASGTVIGVTLLETPDTGPTPIAFVAT